MHGKTTLSDKTEVFFMKKVSIGAVVIAAVIYLLLYPAAAVCVCISFRVGQNEVLRCGTVPERLCDDSGADSR